jgi:hypothetical protein
MARPKSPTGSKASRTNNQASNTEQPNVSTEPSVPEVKPLVAKSAPIENKAVAEIKGEPRKLEVVRTEPRKNILPINLEDEIRRRAYELYQQRGNRTGSEADDWFAAESEIRQRYRQHSA